tara:strand:+ start:1409 stop:1612 length:204 start_codon:yes stop_codon:yes gene_type:complete
MIELISLLTICLVVVLLCNCIFNLCSHFCDYDKKEKPEQEIKYEPDIPVIVVNPNGNLYVGRKLDNY